MKTQEQMVQDVVTATPEETVGVAARRMREENVGCLVVMDGVIKGIITDRDLLGCISEGHDPQGCPLSCHMTAPVVTASPEEDLLRVTQRMSERQIKRVPIVRNDQLVGLLSFADISRAVDDQAQNMWSEWIQLARLVRAEARHRRGGP